MQLKQRIQRSMYLELTSADLTGALTAITQAQILIWDIQIVDELTLRFRISYKQWTKINKILMKRGEQAAICGREGLVWQLLCLRNRPVLVFGMALLLIISLWVPGRIFFIQVEGNCQIPSQKIAEAAMKCGISFGCSRRNLRSEQIKNGLLKEIPELSWSGVNTYGCTAVISVRERTEPEQESPKPSVSSIVASRDGVIRQITVVRGNGLCRPGQTVSAGQVLISGYTDCGISIQATAAKGEVFAETRYTMTTVCPTSYHQRTKIQAQKKKYSLIIGKKRIFFSNNSGISGAGCAKIYEEKYITLPGGFVLPLGIAVETWIAYDTAPAACSVDLASVSQRYLIGQMCCGSILASDETQTESEGLLTLQGSYSCYEMIGITRIEENVPNYVKND